MSIELKILAIIILTIAIMFFTNKFVKDIFILLCIFADAMEQSDREMDVEADEDCHFMCWKLK